MGYSVILPTLNEAGHIVKLIEKIRSIFSEIQEEFEIILADDNSTDGTVELGENIGKKLEKYKDGTNEPPDDKIGIEIREFKNKQFKQIYT